MMMFRAANLHVCSSCRPRCRPRTSNSSLPSSEEQHKVSSLESEGRNPDGNVDFVESSSSSPLPRPSVSRPPVLFPRPRPHELPTRPFPLQLHTTARSRSRASSANRPHPPSSPPSLKPARRKRRSSRRSIRRSALRKPPETCSIGSRPFRTLLLTHWIQVVLPMSILSGHPLRYMALPIMS